MAANKETVGAIYNLLSRHMDRETMDSFLDGLAVIGRQARNQSVKQTIQALVLLDNGRDERGR